MSGRPELTAEAWFWRLERSDGVTLGFTSHDRDLWRDQLLYRAKPGLLPTTIVSALGLEDDSLDVSGALSDESIAEADLLGGRWDEARIVIHRGAWDTGAPLGSPVFVGELGGFGRSGQGFVADVRGPAALLDRPVAPVTSPACRATFCDAACTLSAARFTIEVTIGDMTERSLAVTSPAPLAPGAYANGLLRWLSGPAAGLVHTIEDNGAAAIGLTDPIDIIVPFPARAAIRQGCDKSIATCASRFGNAVNFRGEPFLPGNDLLTRYPGAA